MSRRSPIVAVAVVIVALGAGACGSGGNGSNSSSGGSGTTTKTGAQTRAVTVTGAPLPRYTGDTPDPAVGRTIPTIDGQSFDGQPVQIAPNGRAKVLLGVAHWCPHCQREVPLLSANIRANPLPASIDMVAISTSVQPNGPNYPPQTWLQREKWPTPVLADNTNSAAADALGLSGFPYFVFVDAQGKVVSRTSGEIPVTQFRDLVNRLGP